MSSKDEASTTFAQDLVEISRLLTAIARRTHEKPNGDEERHDFGEVVAIAVTTAAANLGGVDALLAGRPGSWEADYVRQIVRNTTVEEELHGYRTEPIQLVLDPESVFEDLRLEALFAQDVADVSKRYASAELDDEAAAAHDATVDAENDALEAMYYADLDAYFAAYVGVLQEIAAERGYNVPVEVKRVTNYETEPAWDVLAADLHRAARARTPLPSGIAPKDYLGDVAEAERAAHRTYAERVQAQKG